MFVKREKDNVDRTLSLLTGDMLVLKRMKIGSSLVGIERYFSTALSVKRTTSVVTFCRSDKESEVLSSFLHIKDWTSQSIGRFVSNRSGLGVVIKDWI